MGELWTGDITRKNSELELTGCTSLIVPESGDLRIQHTLLDRLSEPSQIKSTLPSFNWNEFLIEWVTIGCNSSFVIPDELNKSDIDLTSRMETLLFCLENNQILFPNYIQVLGYLSSHLELAGTLPFICMLTRNVFQENAQLSLEVYTDPEIEDTHLCLYVRQKDYEIGLMKKIRKISKDSNELTNNISGWIHVTSDGRPPI